jgi:predicted secreted protein
MGLREIDSRSGKVIVVSHCLLNHNSKVYPLATKKGVDENVIGVILETGAGVLQLPCPETIYLGLRRWWFVKEQYDNTGYIDECRRLLEPALREIIEFSRIGYKMVVIGVDGSPSCGVDKTISNKMWMGNPASASEYKIIDGKGVFMEVLENELVSRGIKVPFIGYKGYLPGYDENKALEQLRNSLRKLGFYD